jgi:transposase
MHRVIDGEDRLQQALLPHSLEDYVGEENPVRVIEVFIDELDLAALGFAGMTPAATGRPAYHPSTLLKIYLYGYLNRVQSSRRLEREAQRNIGRLAPDFKTIADFRRDNGAAIRAVCSQFVVLCFEYALTRSVYDARNKAGYPPWTEQKSCANSQVCSENLRSEPKTRRFGTHGCAQPKNSRARRAQWRTCSAGSPIHPVRHPTD